MISDLLPLDDAYVFSRIRGLKGRLLSLEETRQLSSSNSFNDFLSKLSGTEYATSLGKSNIDDIHSIEVALMTHHTNHSRFVLALTPDKFKPIVEALISRNEVMLLKDIFYSKTDVGGSAYLKEYTFMLSKNLWSKHVHLLEAVDYESLINLLKGTKYHDPLKKVIMSSKGSLNPNSFTFALDKLFFTMILQKAETLPEPDRSAVLKLFTSEINALNLTIFLRSKHHGLSFPDYIIPIHNAFTRQLSQLSEEGDILSVLPLIGFPLEDSVIDALKENDVFTLERLLLKNVKRNYTKLFFRGEGGVAEVIAYLKLKEFEVGNIWIIASGILNKLKQDRIRQTLNS